VPRPGLTSGALGPSIVSSQEIPGILFTVFWLAGYLGVRIPGFTVPLDLRILQHTWISGINTQHTLSVWMFTAGRMVLRFFLGSHVVAVSAPFMMHSRIAWYVAGLNSEYPGFSRE